ncbi:hypothetical protein V8C35DRAFT_322933 [Trichoderma chlorosporum]
MKPWGNEGDGGQLLHSSILDSMETEKSRYRGERHWNQLEERLFEILFLRQEISLLPLHWELDFRGIPVSGDLFCWQKGVKPIVYARTTGFTSGFRATMALTRLIDLTTNVRTTCQSGLRRKTPQMIKNSLDKYLSWAAEDGGYKHLKYTPNITVEVVDITGERIDVGFIETRMRELAQSHREELCIKTEQEDVSADMDIDKEAEMQIKSETEASAKPHPGSNRSRSWRAFGSQMMSRLLKLLRRPVIKPESHGETSVIDSGDDEPTTGRGKQARDREYVKREEEEEESYVRIKKEQFGDSDDDMTMADIPMAPTTLATTAYLRPPPVVFGFFVVATSAFLLTADSSKEDADMTVNFHVQLDFQDRTLGVWNALTVAIAACLARDDMVKRMGDFEEEHLVEESDPDA